MVEMEEFPFYAYCAEGLGTFDSQEWSRMMAVRCTAYRYFCS